jgi:uncharacterized protein (DUF2236 family)
MPQTVEDFWPYFRRMLSEELERTLVVDELIAVDRPLPPPDRGPFIVRAALRLLWPVLRPAFLRFRRFVTVGLMPPDVREAIGLPWTRRQERRLVRLGRVVRTVVPRLPERLRFLPAAYAARKAYRAGLRG